jgi:ligand-binding sensor domain-containing protein/DNA-binding CsgD family transcriptional regulator
LSRFKKDMLKKGKKFLFLIMLASLLTVAAANTNQRNIRFRNLTVGDGLSQSIVHCIFQDRSGFIWCGTLDGLNKYDGTGFKIYRPVPGQNNSLSHKQVNTICEDKQGRLWIGTSSGLNLLDRKRDRFIHYKASPANPTALSHNSIKILYVDRRGTLWIGTWGGGLNKMEDARGRFTHYKHNTKDNSTISSNWVQCIYEDHQGFLWVSASKGFNRFHREKNVFTRYFYQVLPGKKIKYKEVTAIIEDHKNTLWITTKKGLYYLDRETNTFQRYFFETALIPGPKPKSFTLNALVEDQNKRLWIGTHHHGLIRLDPSSGQVNIFRHDLDNPWSLIHDKVLTIYQDRSGLIWLGTGGGGISIYNDKREVLQHYQQIPGNPHSLNNNSIWSIYEDRSGIIWVGTGGGSLNRIDRENNTYRFFLHQRNNPRSITGGYVYSIIEDFQGMMWIGTDQGLNRFDRYREIFTRYTHTGDSSGLSHNHVYKVIEDPCGDLWIGTPKGGLNRYYREQGTFGYYRHDPQNPHSLSSDHVTDIFQDSSGNLWIGTEGGGLNFLPYKADKFIHYQYIPGCSNCLSHNNVISILKSRSGMLWIGTRGGGLNRFDPEKKIFTHYTIKNGLPSDIIYGILEDHQANLWLSTNKGITRFNPYTKLSRNFTTDDGIQGYEFNSRVCFKSRSGELFFGGLNGFNCFYPDRIKDNLYVPPIVITGLQVIASSNNGNHSTEQVKQYPVSQPLTLSYKDNIFSIRYAALDFSQPEKNQYKYRLEGFTDQWIYLGNKTETTFTNLDPGRYVFHVRGSNNDGIWNNEGASLVVVITPPFWKAWWFRVLLIGLGIFLLQFWHRWRLKHREIKIKTEEEFKHTAELYNISPREREILALVLKGKSNKDIEDELFIADKTVKTHIYNIYRKVGVKNRLELINKFHLSPKQTPANHE